MDNHIFVLSGAICFQLLHMSDRSVFHHHPICFIYLKRDAVELSTIFKQECTKDFGD